MILRYAGHKPIITHTGVNFSIGKEDKYRYLQPATLLLQALNSAPQGSTLNLETNKSLTEMQIIDTLKIFRPKIQAQYDERIEKYKLHIQDEIASVDHHSWLSDLEKEVWKKNIACMEDFLVQRAGNKFFYEEVIHAIIEMIEQKKIEHIVLPFSFEFLHIAQSIEMTLRIVTTTYKATMWVPQEEKPSHIELRIEHIDMSLVRV